MVKIYRNPNGDTRTAPQEVNFDAFQEANDMHRQDVSAIMWELSKMVDSAGEYHDATKKTQERMFYRDFVDSQRNGSDFVKSEWYQLHIHAQRHHLINHCPDDVNLIDMMEMIVNCVCAGMARSGEVRELEIKDDILKKAVENTVKLVKDMIIIEEM